MTFEQLLHAADFECVFFYYDSWLDEYKVYTLKWCSVVKPDKLKAQHHYFNV